MARDGMRIGSLFAGIGGLELGLERAGVGHTVWQVEQDAFCRSVLARRWPNVERLEDVKEVGRHNLASVDLICGGFPCQDISSAGKGAGLAGERSGLWFEFARIIGELRPTWVVVENVASGARRWVDAVMAGLGELGYEALPVPLSARDVGAPHLRRRIFIVARNADRERQSAIAVDAQVAWVRGDSGSVADPERVREPIILHCDCGGESELSGLDEPCEWCDAIGAGYVTYPERVELWKQQGRGGGSSGQREAEPGAAGAARQAADATGDRRSAEWERPEDRYAQWSSELQHGIEEGWIPQPTIRRVDDGLPSRVDGRDRRRRLKALGNAVVPQMAEVIGYVVLELL